MSGIQIFVVGCLALATRLVLAMQDSRPPFRPFLVSNTAMPLRIEDSFKAVVREQSDRDLHVNARDTLVLIARKGPNAPPSTPKTNRLIYTFELSDSLMGGMGRRELIDVIQWTYQNRRASLELKLLRPMHGGRLMIFLLQIQKRKEYKKMIYSVENYENGEVPDNTFLVMDVNNINLVVPPDISLTLLSAVGRPNEIPNGDDGIINCTASGGIPKVRPRLLPNPLPLQPPKRSLTDSSRPRSDNELIERFQATTIDHLKEITCVAGESMKKIKINVLHKPTQVLLEPDLPEARPSNAGIDTDKPNLRWGRLANGSSLDCSAVDGFPRPNVRWTIVSVRPQNASVFHSILPTNPERFSLHSAATLGSRWILNCTSTNLDPITARSNSYVRTVAFVVDRPDAGLFEIHLTMQIVIGVAVAGAITLFCVVTVLISCVARRGCCGPRDPRDHPGAASSGGGPEHGSGSQLTGQSAVGARHAMGSGRHYNNGVTAKAAEEKKDLDSEQVTLLPPGVPQAGSPPPVYYPLQQQQQPASPTNVVTPLRDLSNNQQQQHQYPPLEQEPELTYAELSGPVHQNPAAAPTAAPSAVTMGDDGVIYSQIVGTASPAAPPLNV